MAAASSQPGSRRAGRGRLLRRAATTAALTAVAAPSLVLGGGTGSATTGDSYVLPPSQYVLPMTVIKPYVGSYRIAKVAKASRLYAANVFIGQNSYHDMYGGGVFYGYDSTGAQEDWTNVLYGFHLVPPAGGHAVTPWTTARQAKRDELIVSLYGWGSPSLGTMWLHRKANGDLSGSIRLRNQTRRYPISFQKISNHS
jgi:hypothetical protein